MTASHVKIWLLVLLAIGGARWLTRLSAPAGSPLQPELGNRGARSMSKCNGSGNRSRLRFTVSCPSRPSRKPGRQTIGYWQHRRTSPALSGAARIRLQVDRAAYSIESTAQALWYDSDAPENPPEAAPLRRILEPLVATAMILEGRCPGPRDRVDREHQPPVPGWRRIRPFCPTSRRLRRCSPAEWHRAGLASVLRRLRFCPRQRRQQLEQAPGSEQRCQGLPLHGGRHGHPEQRTDRPSELRGGAGPEAAAQQRRTP